MFSLRPKTAPYVLGFFVFLGLFDSLLRFGIIPIASAVCNPGIAFGIFLSESALWLGIGTFLTLALIQALPKPSSDSSLNERLAWRTVFIGGLVNAADRLAHGCVIDYLHLWFFPSFNLADMMLFLGVIFLLATAFGSTPKAKTYVG